MGRRPSTFTQSDVERAMKAVRNGGFDNGAVEFTTEGNVRFEFGNNKDESKHSSSFEKWIGKRDANET